MNNDPPPSDALCGVADSETGPDRGTMPTPTITDPRIVNRADARARAFPRFGAADSGAYGAPPARPLRRES